MFGYGSISDPTIVDQIGHFLFYVSTWMFIYITIHSEWGLA